MKIFLDSANIEEIREANRLGILSGVTTNPSLVAKSGRVFEEVLKEIVSVVDGSVSAEVLSRDARGMIEEGEHLSAISPQITVKIPMTKEGLQAVHHFHQKQIPTNVTLIFTANQALLAARAGATYVSPFVGRLDDTGQDGLHLIEQIVEIFDLHRIDTEIIAASVRNPLHVLDAAMCGAHIATLPFKIIEQMMNHPLTTQGIEKFEADWKAAQKSNEE